MALTLLQKTTKCVVEDGVITIYQQGEEEVELYQSLCDDEFIDVLNNTLDQLRYRVDKIKFLEFVFKEIGGEKVGILHDTLWKYELENTSLYQTISEVLFPSLPIQIKSGFSQVQEIFKTELELSDRVKYEGEAIILNGKAVPHGYGKTMDLNNSIVFTGFYYNGIKDKGITGYANGDFFIGFYKNNHPSGIGYFNQDLCYACGNKFYVGSLVNDTPVSEGTIYYLDGRVYNGSLVIIDCYDHYDFYPHGIGMLEFASGRVLSCVFHNSMPIGICVMEYPNGCVYEGEVDGILTRGNGKLTFVDGKYFEGTFVQGIPSTEKVTQEENVISTSEDITTESNNCQ